jgi:hypothetical protein
MPRPRGSPPDAYKKKEPILNKRIFALGMLLLLSGCDYDLPKVDGAYLHRLDGAGPKTELTFLQVAALSDWFAAHRDSWAREIADVFPGTLITFRRKGADVVTANFTGTQVKIGGKVRSLTMEEATALKRILGEEKG